MLQDERWYVVRNMVAILGEIGRRECVAAMKATANHDDQRVRKEAIRSLVKIGGKEAEAIIIGLLADRNQAIVRQSILSLGIMKSKSAMQPLIEIVAERELFLGSLDMKKEALQAIGRIGDRRAGAYLLELLESRHFVVWNRWEELKAHAAAALGQIGDESALPVLKKKAERGGLLGSACSEAVDNIERVAVSNDE
jgi:HEAT repeat protein